MTTADFIKNELSFARHNMKEWKVWKGSCSPDIGQGYLINARNTLLSLRFLINCEDISVPYALSKAVTDMYEEIYSCDL